MKTLATPDAGELNGRLDMLRIFKTAALEQLEENERVIAAQKTRIAELEFHLKKCRDSAYQTFYATAGVLPIVNGFNQSPDEKPKKVKGKK